MSNGADGDMSSLWQRLASEGEATRGCVCRWRATHRGRCEIWPTAMTVTIIYSSWLDMGWCHAKRQAEPWQLLAGAPYGIGKDAGRTNNMRLCV